MNDPIWAPKMGEHSICLKIPYKSYEISLALDDSCGAFDLYWRGGFAVFRGPDNVTQAFGASEGNTLPADAETLKAIFYKIDLLEKP